MQVTMHTVYAGVDPETGSPLTLRPGETHEFPKDVAGELIAGGFGFDPVAKRRQPRKRSSRRGARPRPTA